MYFCFGIILIIPFFVGLQILTQSNRNKMSLMAGLLSFKPIVLTPIWWLQINDNGVVNRGNELIAILPAIIATGLIVIVFHSLFVGAEMRKAAWLLLIMDCIRWMSSYGFTTYTSNDTFAALIMFLSITMPVIFAIVAMALVSREPVMLRKSVEKKKRYADVWDS